MNLNFSVLLSVVKKKAVLKSIDKDTNHFDLINFSEGKRWDLPEFDITQYCFTKANEELDKKVVKLTNAGLDSKLKIIPKESVF